MSEAIKEDEKEEPEIEEDKVESKEEVKNSENATDNEQTEVKEEAKKDENASNNEGSSNKEGSSNSTHNTTNSSSSNSGGTSSKNTNTNSGANTNQGNTSSNGGSTNSGTSSNNSGSSNNGGSKPKPTRPSGIDWNKSDEANNAFGIIQAYKKISSNLNVDTLVSDVKSIHNGQTPSSSVDFGRGVKEVYTYNSYSVNKVVGQHGGQYFPHDTEKVKR